MNIFCATFHHIQQFTGSDVLATELHIKRVEFVATTELEAQAKAERLAQAFRALKEPVEVSCVLPVLPF